MSYPACISRSAFARRIALWCAALLVALAPPAMTASAETLSDATRKKLDQNWHLCLVKKKGPFSANTCVCKNGTKEMVRKVNGKLIVPCGGAFVWCEAFRSDWGRALAEEDVWVGNLFQRDVYEWNQIGDPHALVQGYALEHDFIETNPGHKLDQLRAYGGLSGAEYEAAALPGFLDLYLAMPDFDADVHHLTTFELLRRYRVRNDPKEILRVRNLSSAIQAKDRKFKPYRDRTHNQISASLVPILRTYRDSLPPGSPLAPKVDELMAAVQALVTPTDDDLRSRVASLPPGATRSEMEDALGGLNGTPSNRAAALARLLVAARRTEAEGVPPRARLEIGVDAWILLNAQLAASPDDRVRLARATAADAAFGSGLVTEDEYEDLRADVGRGDRQAAQDLRSRAEAHVEAAYAPVLPAWRHVAPSTDGFAARVVRASPVGALSADD